MKSRKYILRLLAVFLCLSLALCCVPLAAAENDTALTFWENPFEDVASGSWYYNAVAEAYGMKLFSGTDGSHFSPSADMTRAMLVTVLWRCADCPAVTAEEPMFTDVPEGLWYTDAALWAAENDIVAGVGDGLFAPDDSVSREQIVTILYRYAEFSETELAVTAQMPEYPDALELSDWAQEAMQWAVERGLVSGVKAADGTVLLQPKGTASRAQVATILVHFFGKGGTVYACHRTLTYGTSGSGTYPLLAHQIGDGKNVMVLTFCLHGWEDNFSRDGAELVILANDLVSVLMENYSVIRSKNWRVYVLPCVNPDGLNLGTTCNGPGRCTTTYYNSSGALVSDGKRGIDMNRCFPYKYSSMSSSYRNFNGTAPLQCAEARALADFVTDVKGSGYNICIDTHGWFHQIIPGRQNGTIHKAFLKQFSGSSYANLKNGSGYFASWAAFSLGYDGCLFELPGGIYSHQAFLNSGYIGRFEKVILDLLNTYQ